MTFTNNDASQQYITFLTAAVTLYIRLLEIHSGEQRILILYEHSALVDMAFQKPLWVRPEIQPPQTTCEPTSRSGAG